MHCIVTVLHAELEVATGCCYVIWHEIGVAFHQSVGKLEMR